LEIGWIRREKILLLKELVRRRCWEASRLSAVHGHVDGRQEFKPQTPTVKGPSARTSARALAGRWLFAELKLTDGFT